MPALTHDLLVRGTAAAKAGEKSEAIRYFIRLLGLDPTPEEQAEAWHWLAQLSEDPAQQKNYLDEILARNPGDARARRAMATLTGELNPAEIIDADKIPAKIPSQPIRSIAQRFTCANCGARMVYTTDGQELICENCGSRRPVGGLKSRISKPESGNFTAAMATERGHITPIHATVTTCLGCGAEFQMPAKSLSINCPYCGSSYATASTGEKEIIQPVKLIPFKLALKHVRQTLQSWFESEGFEHAPAVAVPTGIYIPVWSFVVGGQLSWVGSIEKNKVWTPFHDAKILNQNDVLVWATRRLPEVAENLLPTYNLKELVSFDPHYLADWLAETYQVPVGDASLSARKMVLDLEKVRIEGQYDSRITNLRLNSTSMAVDSYQLILVPLWLTQFEHKENQFNVAINGQNGQVIGQKPAGGLADWISGIFNG